MDILIILFMWYIAFLSMIMVDRYLHHRNCKIEILLQLLTIIGIVFVMRMVDLFVYDLSTAYDYIGEEFGELFMFFLMFVAMIFAWGSSVLWFHFFPHHYERHTTWKHESKK